MKDSTEEALRLFRNMFPEDKSEKILVLGSLHNIPFSCDTNIDWDSRDNPRGNANFRLNDINNGDWNVIINCCCEQMIPMEYITLKGVYILQSNNRYTDAHINRSKSMSEFRNQCGLSEIYFEDTLKFLNTTYYTIFGEKW